MTYLPFTKPQVPRLLMSSFSQPTYPLVRLSVCVSVCFAVFLCVFASSCIISVPPLSNCKLSFRRILPPPTTPFFPINHLAERPESLSSQFYFATFNYHNFRIQKRKSFLAPKPQRPVSQWLHPALHLNTPSRPRPSPCGRAGCRASG